MSRQRIRVRFAKEGDLRFISHLDLMRAFERALRRSGLPLQMSEGFNPRPRMSFPAPLGVGIEGSDEAMEFELARDVAVRDVNERLGRALPPGLELKSVESLPPGKPTQVSEMAFVVAPAIPGDPEAHIEPEQAHELMGRTEIPVERMRKGRRKTVDIRPFLLALDASGGVLTLRVKAGPSGSTRPEEILGAMGFPAGRIPLLFRMKRTRVVLSKPR